MSAQLLHLAACAYLTPCVGAQYYGLSSARAVSWHGLSRYGSGAGLGCVQAAMSLSLDGQHLRQAADRMPGLLFCSWPTVAGLLLFSKIESGTNAESCNLLRKDCCCGDCHVMYASSMPKASILSIWPKACTVLCSLVL